MHAPLTIAALQAGKHVACEKPSTLDVEENKQIIAAADKAKRKVIFLSARMRWGACILAREYIQRGDVGEIYRVDVQHYRSRGRPGVDIVKNARWFTSKKLAGGGMLMDMGQYFMDVVLNLTGWPVISTVSATTFKGISARPAAGCCLRCRRTCHDFRSCREDDVHVRFRQYCQPQTGAAHYHSRHAGRDRHG